MNPAMERIVTEQLPEARTKGRARFLHKAAFADCVLILAGPAAEYLARGEPLEDWQDWASSTFLDDEAADFAEEGTDNWDAWQRQPFLGRRWRLHLQRAFETADHIVRHHQPHIEALAEHLARHGEVDGEEVYRLFDAAGEAVRR